MKFLILIGMGILLTHSAEGAVSKDNNKKMVECLVSNGYDYNLPAQERVNSAKWNEISACYHTWSDERRRKEYAKMKEFIKENPWYKGPNWRWTLYSEYECSQVYDDAVGINHTVCSKPKYYKN
jgi:hypothetical protein